MPSRLSGIFSRSSKAEEAKAEEAAANNQIDGQPSEPLPEYSVTQQHAQPPPPDYCLEDDIPPDYTAGFANLRISDDPSLEIPDVSEATAHLKTLECFYRLKQKIASTDGLFGIENSKIVDIARVSGLSNGDGAKELLPKVAEKRWAVFVSRAVDRFQAWISAAVPSVPMPSMTELEHDGRQGLIIEPQYVKRSMGPIGIANMPPVDVLMVWHAYMLNPRAYLEDCIRNGRMALWNTRMPWNAIAQRINTSTFAFEAGAAAEGFFADLTGHHWDNFLDGDSKHLNCPNCHTESAVPWTTCNAYEPDQQETLKDLAANVDTMLSSGIGFSDRGFAFECSVCGTILTHNVLRAGKFCTDVKLLIAHGTPMPGTLLGLRGFPFKVGYSTDPKWTGVYRRVNRLLNLGLGQKILDMPHLHGEGVNQSIPRIRDMIGETLSENKKYMRIVRDAASGHLLRLERVGFRKMMSRYWDNSSPFALDLTGAVIRQGGFVEKMHNIDWLHSPALPATMTRLLLKYERFVKIMAQAENMAVPTLDVDLAWHTHQLNPPSYLKYIVNQTRQFIDHDDKVAETALNDAFAWTSKTYEKMYGDKYSECTCWYCEAIRESNSSPASRLFSSKGKQKAHNFEQDPKKSVHISAHNAVQPTGDEKYTVEAQAQAAKLEAQFQKACEKAKKKGNPEPKRKDYYWSVAYGYPVYLPIYAPFAIVPYNAGFYPLAASPGCMSIGPNGGCAAGTCSGAVSAGACGAGHCAGGTTGGCSGGQTLGGCGSGGCGSGGCAGGGGGN